MHVIKCKCASFIVSGLCVGVAVVAVDVAKAKTRSTNNSTLAQQALIAAVGKGRRHEGAWRGASPVSKLNERRRCIAVGLLLDSTERLGRTCTHIVERQGEWRVASPQNDAE